MKKRVRFDLIIVYYVIAIVLSMFFRVDDLNPAWYINLKQYDYGWLFVRLLRALGPLTGGVLCILIFRKKYNRTITLKGKSFSMSIIYFLAPVLLITLMGISGSHNHNIHVFGLIT